MMYKHDIAFSCSHQKYFVIYLLVVAAATPAADHFFRALIDIIRFIWLLFAKWLVMSCVLN